MSGTRNMQTPSDLLAPAGAQSATRPIPRSIYGNYSPRAAAPADDPPPVALPAGWAPTVDGSLARAFVYRFLAQAFEYPTREGWTWLSDPGTHSAFQAAVRVCAAISFDHASGADGAMLDAAVTLVTGSETGALDDYLTDYIALFGHAARGTCPLNEIEYGDLKADPLFQPHRLADLAAFYRAFGLELADDAAERPDHLAIELEFMAVLAAAEAFAVEQHLDETSRAIGYQAQRHFLREHLGRWIPGFARRLERMAGAAYLGCLARFTREFIHADCRRFQVQPGSDELCLRPADEATESMCDSCGLVNSPTP